MPADPITPGEIDAWIDGELDLPRRLSVERHLSRAPSEAAAVMGDLADRTALRLANEPGEDMPPDLLTAAQALAGRLAYPTPPSRRARAAWGGGLAVAAALVIAIATYTAPPPDYVDDAVAAYRTGLLRAKMPSQLESPTLDLHEIARSTRIRVPRLPAGWRVTDVQIFPSEDGPALQIMAMTPERTAVSIFAIRADSDASPSPETVQQGTTSAAFWRIRDMSYALVGTGGPNAIDPVAERLAAERPI